MMIDLKFAMGVVDAAPVRSASIANRYGEARTMRLVPRHILRILALAVGLLLVLGAPVANADPRAPSGYHPQSAPEKRVALVIGNNDYQDKGVTPLTNAVNDAQAVSRELGKVGFEVMPYTNLNLAGMLDAIDDFVAKLAPGGVGLVFYAGHAVEVDSVNYLLPIDISANVSPARIGHAAVKLSDLMNRLEKSRQKLSLYILDACRNNPFPKNGAITREYGDAGGLAPPPAPEGTMVIYSAQKGQRALDRLSSTDKNPNGLFTREFLPLITRPGLRIDEALRQVRANVKTKAAAVGKLQVPALYNEMDGDFYFIGGPPLEASEKELYEEAKRIGTAESYQAYVNQYPKGRYAAFAIAAINKLRQVAPPPVTPPTVVVAPQPPQQAQYRDLQAFRDCADCPEMVVIPAGRFQMGGDKYDEEKPVHAVTIGKAFALGKTEITVGQYLACVNAGGCAEPEWREKGSKYHYQTGSDDYYRKFGAALTGESNPIVGVSWDNARQYGLWLSQKTGKPYRLPSESEWEYACRAGGSHTYCGGNDLDALAWYNKNSDNKTHPVAGKQANAYGLYDMSGNVWEWVEDCGNKNYEGAPKDGSAWKSGDCAVRVARGGSWFDVPDGARAAGRDGFVTTVRNYIIGFRLARMLP